LFLAIDKGMTEQKAEETERAFKSVLDELESSKIRDKKLNRKIKLTYSNVHGRFLKKYIENEYFSELFETGVYNCVTASMLFALIFDEFNIPYKVMASPNHVYLVANPGPHSIVIETTNPGLEQKIFTGEFKQQYVNHLRNSKLISESEMKSRSVEEIFEAHFKEVRDAEFRNLTGFQYYNMALSKYFNNEFEEAYLLCQKAYFFYPETQVKSLLYNSLAFHLEKCDFDRVQDIDYLAQLSRFSSISDSDIAGIFSNIIHHHIQYTDKEAYCDSLHVRLVSQLSDKDLIEEISFTYYLMMSYSFQHSDKIERYVVNALDLRGNHYDAIAMFENHFNRKLYTISDGRTLSDTILQIECRYDQERVKKILEQHKLRSILLFSGDSYKRNKPKEGESYLLEFEQQCRPPLKDQMLVYQVEDAYRQAAVYYFYRGLKTKARSFVDRGLKYAPNSRSLKSAVY
jgi:hypothetical protein